MPIRTVIHLFLHLAVPGLGARAFYPEKWKSAWFVMFATMLVDLDHLLANPVFDSNRCSIGYHPLHSYWAVAVYAILAVPARTRLIGLGLLIHMFLDWTDCVWMKGCV